MVSKIALSLALVLLVPSHSRGQVQTALFIDDEGQVGIGTDTPTKNLTVAGSANFSEGIVAKSASLEDSLKVGGIVQTQRYLRLIDFQPSECESSNVGALVYSESPSNSHWGDLYLCRRKKDQGDYEWRKFQLTSGDPSFTSSGAISGNPSEEHPADGEEGSNGLTTGRVEALELELESLKRRVERLALSSCRMEAGGGE